MIAGAYLIGLTLSWDRGIKGLQEAFLPTLEDSSNGAIYLEADSYYWVSYANEMADTGKWRIRETQIDNAPFGRPVYWSQAFSWLLVGYGGITHFFTGLPMRGAIENGSIWVNPSLQLLLILVIGFIIKSRLNLVAAVLAGAWILTSGDLFWCFHPLRPDHQSLHCLFAGGAFALLLFGGLGWTCDQEKKRADGLGSWGGELTIPSLGRAKWYFTLAGVMGGMGIWTGATTQIVVLTVVAGISFWLIFFMPRSAETAEWKFYPELWRYWAVAGAVTSAVFYLLEFFPSLFMMRLEVVHPWYAIVWLGLGELVVGVGKFRIGKVRCTVLQLSWYAVSALAVLSFLIAVLWGPGEWHNMRNPEMLRLHAHIVEFQSYLAVGGAGGLNRFFYNFLSLPLFLVGGIFLGLSPRLKLAEWGAVWLATFSSLAFLGLSLLQVRWLNLYALMNCLQMTVVVFVAFSVMNRVKGVQHGWLTAALAVMLVQPFYMGVRNFSRISVPVEAMAASDLLVKPVMDKRFALRWRKETGGSHPIVLADPGMAPVLAYFGKAPAIPSYYWENLQGLSDAAAFFADVSETEARKVVEKRKIDFVVVYKSLQLAEKMTFVRNGGFSRESLERCLAGRLAHNSLDVPGWLKMDYELTNRLQPVESVGDDEFRGNRIIWSVKFPR